MSPPTEFCLFESKHRKIEMQTIKRIKFIDRYLKVKMVCYLRLANPYMVLEVFRLRFLLLVLTVETGIDETTIEYNDYC